jgi:hypothetical protein
MESEPVVPSVVIGWGVGGTPEGESLNTVPRSFAPPPRAVPYKLPLASRIRVQKGPEPLVPSNETSVVSVCVPAATSNTVPCP